MTKFITLAGRKQVGKDLSARYIQNIIEGETETKVHIVHFADALKRACSEIFGIPLAQMETEIGKQELTDVCWPVYDESSMGNVFWRPGSSRLMTVREVLQFVGTELFRTQMDPDIWVKSVFRRSYADDDIVVVADCRFPNEADFAKEHGLLIKVARDTNFTDSHISETALDAYSNHDELIDNNGSFEDLRLALRSILVKHGFIK